MGADTPAEIILRVIARAAPSSLIPDSIKISMTAQMRPRRTPLGRSPFRRLQSNNGLVICPDAPPVILRVLPYGYGAVVHEAITPPKMNRTFPQAPRDLLTWLRRTHSGPIGTLEPNTKRVLVGDPDDAQDAQLGTVRFGSKADGARTYQDRPLGAINRHGISW